MGFGLFVDSQAKKYFVGTATIIALLVVLFMWRAFMPEGRSSMEENKSQNDLQLISPAFRDNAKIPIQYTCKGQNISPPLNIFNISPKTKSLALIMHDPDAPSGDFLHWLVWDIASNTETIAVNSLPPGAVQGPNGSGANKYMGPCPPAGTGDHHYVFELFALDQTLGLKPDTLRQQLQAAMEGHILQQTKFTGIFGVD